MREDDIIEEEEQTSGVYILEWMVTLFLAGIFLFFIVKFLFF